MNKQKIFLLSILLIVVAIFTYIDMPKKFETEGGSCYQGITATIIRFFLKICIVLNSIAIILASKSRIKTGKIVSIISLSIWSLISLINSIDKTSEDFLIGIKYFSPFLIVHLIIILTINKFEVKKLF